MITCLWLTPSKNIVWRAVTSHHPGSCRKSRTRGPHSRPTGWEICILVPSCHDLGPHQSRRSTAIGILYWSLKNGFPRASVYKSVQQTTTRQRLTCLLPKGLKQWAIAPWRTSLLNHPFLLGFSWPPPFLAQIKGVLCFKRLLERLWRRSGETRRSVQRRWVIWLPTTSPIPTPWEVRGGQSKKPRKAECFLKSC